MASPLRKWTFRQWAKWLVAKASLFSKCSYCLGLKYGPALLRWLVFPHPLLRNPRVTRPSGHSLWLIRGVTRPTEIHFFVRTPEQSRSLFLLSHLFLHTAVCKYSGINEAKRRRNLRRRRRRKGNSNILLTFYAPRKQTLFLSILFGCF